MSDSVRSHRRKPTRLPCPWDSPGKNTGVGCHFLLQCMKVKEQSEVAQSCPTLSDPMDYSLPGSSIHGIFQARVLEWGAIAFSAHSRIEGTKISRVQLYGVFEKLYESESHSVLSDSLRPHGIYSPWNSPGQNTGVGCHALLQGIFPTQGLNPSFLHCRWILFTTGPPLSASLLIYKFRAAPAQTTLLIPLAPRP